MFNKKYLVVFIVLLVALMTVSVAADVTNTNTKAKVTKDTSKVTNTQKIVKTTENTKKIKTNNKDNITSKKTNSKTKTEVKKVNKSKNVKTTQKTVEVNNTDEMVATINSAVNDADNNEYIINLNPGTYKNTAIITMEGGLYRPNIIINGNNQILAGSKSLRFSNGCNVTINNISSQQQLQNSNGIMTLNNVVLSKTFTNQENSELNIINSTLNSSITNYGLLTIDDDSTATASFKITKNGKISTNNINITNTLIAQNIYIKDHTFENTLINQLTYNYGDMTVINTNVTQSLTNYGNMNIIDSKLKISDNGMVPIYENYGNLTIKNSTINVTIQNYGNLTIDNDTVLLEKFRLTNEGNVYSNKTEMVDYLKSFNANYTIENRTFSLDQKSNSGILTFINCTLSGTFLGNTGEIFIINSTCNAVLNNGANGKITFENSTFTSIFNDGTLILLDNVECTGKIMRNGQVITNEPNKIASHLQYLNGNYIIENTTITISTNGDFYNGNITIINTTINGNYGFVLTNNGNLTIINSTINGPLTNNGNLTIINSSQTDYLKTILNKAKANLIVDNTLLLSPTTNNGNLTIIFDENKNLDELFGPQFTITGNGIVETENINKIFKYISNFNGVTTIELGDYSKDINNYGDLTVENSTLTGLIKNFQNAAMILKNSTITNSITNQGTLELKNATIDSTITNTGTLIISDDTIFGENFQIIGNGQIIINDTQRVADFLSTYTGNIVLIDKTIDTAKVNQGTLTLKNCTISSTIQNDGCIILDDKTVFTETAQITGTGEIVINNITKILPYITTINGNHEIRDTTLNKNYTFRGRVTLKNCTITAPGNSNVGTLNLTNCTVNVGEENTFIDNFGTLRISKDTEIIGKINNLGGEVDDEGAPKTYVVNNNTITYFFDNNGLTSLVNPGDTLDFQGTIFGVKGLNVIIINKAINIITTTHNGKIVGFKNITFTKGASGSNVTGLYTYNTQFYVWNADHIVFNNISNVVEDAKIGWGVGQTSIRENSSYITVKNSYFYTKNNGGSSTLVLAWANNCIIDNNTIEGDGVIGNMLYITTYNVNIPDNAIFNAHNQLINNRIRGPENDLPICFGICISGVDNLVDNNTINYTGSGIMFQWGSGVDGVESSECLFASGENVVSNNRLYGGCGISAGNLIYNNIMEGKLYVSDAIAYNNTAYRLEVGNGTTEIRNNTLLGQVTFSKGIISSILTNNTITGKINITSEASNILITANIISGSITLDGSNNNITNNTIKTAEEYTISSKKTPKNNIIKDNYLLSKNNGGDDSVNLKDESNIIENNVPINAVIEVTTLPEIMVNKTVPITIVLTTSKGGLLAQQEVTITTSNGTETILLKNGIYVLQYTPTSIGLETITVTYNGNEEYVHTTTTTTINVTETNQIIDALNNTIKEQEKTINEQNQTIAEEQNKVETLNKTVETQAQKLEQTIKETTKLKTTITVDKVTTNIGKTVTIKAIVKDANGKAVTSGKVSLKVNGVVLKDSSDNIIYADVNKGTATIKYLVPASWMKKGLKVEAFYTGDSKYQNSNKTTTDTIKVNKGSSKITLTPNIKTVKAGQKVTINVKQVDTNTKQGLTSTVTVKVNGKTYKVKVKNGEGKLTYTVPKGTDAKTIKATATHSDNYYNKATGKTSFKVTKTTPTIKTTKTTTKSKKTTIKGKILDANNKVLTKNVKVTVKVDGKTVLKNKVVKKGKINLSFKKSLKKGYHELVITSKATKAFNKASFTGVLKV